MKKIMYGAIALTLLVACSKESESIKPVIDLAAGEAIAAADCSGCHGMDGRGETADIPNLAAQPINYLVDAMHAYRDGGRQHAALQDMTAGMSEADITNIAGYYANLPALAHLEQTEAQATDSVAYSEGAEVAAICEECHGERGISTEAGMPSLAGQQPFYLIVSTQEYKSGARGHEGKGEMLEGLEQIDIEKMAMYFAAQPAPDRGPAPFGDPVAGKALSATCGKCHGAKGISHDPVVPNLAGQEPVYLVKAIKAYRDHDRESDEPMPERTDEQIENLAAYYSTQRPVAAVEEALTGEQLAATCNRCHGRAEASGTMVVPALNGQSHDYLVKAMKEYRHEDRENSMMHKMSARYSDEMIEAIATYYANQ